MDPVKQTYAMLDQQAMEEFTDGYKRAQRFRASEVDNCSRRIFYDVSGYEKDSAETGKQQLYGLYGDITHDVVRNLMRKAGVELDGLEFNEDGSVTELINLREQVSHNGVDLTIAARADGIVVVDGKRYGLEIKSVSGFVYDYMHKVYTGTASRKMTAQYGVGTKGLRKYVATKYSKYLKQAHLTAYLAGLDGVYLVIADRSSCQFGFDGDGSALMYDLDMKIVDGVLSKLAMIQRKIRDGEPPMRDYTKGSKECGWCPFKERCWSD